MPDFRDSGNPDRFAVIRWIPQSQTYPPDTMARTVVKRR